MGGKSVFFKTGGKVIRVSKKGLRKALHPTHKIGKLLRDLI